jgi:hypothetical protein
MMEQHITSLVCADLDHLEFLPSGDAAVTRRASKYSKLKAVVLQWSRTRQRYERQGILVETEAIEQVRRRLCPGQEVFRPPIERPANRHKVRPSTHKDQVRSR